MLLRFLGFHVDCLRGGGCGGGGCTVSTWPNNFVPEEDLLCECYHLFHLLPHGKKGPKHALCQECGEKH